MSESLNAAYVTVDPTSRSDWDALVSSLPESTVFHRVGWARVMKETYGHTPLYVCQFEGSTLKEVLPLMELSSAWKGRRGVSLPFTDVSPPLVAGGRSASGLYQYATQLGRERRWKFLECRGGWADWAGAKASLSFYGHAIDLTVGATALFKNLEGSIRRGVRKAEAEGLVVTIGTDAEAMREFYLLQCQTRSRHGLPPQPFRFFANIQKHVLAAGQGFVATAKLNGRPVAASVYLYGGSQALYKFGASDFKYQQLRPNNLVMWRAMQQLAKEGCSSLHLGRTSLGNEGLRRFKLGFGAREETVQYSQYDFGANQFTTTEDRADGWFNAVFSRLPMPLLRLAGEVLYPHLS